jgi:hypothetical protein
MCTRNKSSINPTKPKIFSNCQTKTHQLSKYEGDDVCRLPVGSVKEVRQAVSRKLEEPLRAVESVVDPPRAPPLWLQNVDRVKLNTKHILQFQHVFFFVKYFVKRVMNE